MILTEIFKLGITWSSLMKEFHKVTKLANQRYAELKTIIVYFEHEMLKVPDLIFGSEREFTKDHKKLNKVYYDFCNILAVSDSFTKRVDPLKSPIIQEQLKYFKRMLERLQYLSQLTDDDLLENFYPAILHNNNSSPLTNFTKDQRDTYFNLKSIAFKEREQNNSLNTSSLENETEEEKSSLDFDESEYVRERFNEWMDNPNLKIETEEKLQEAANLKEQKELNAEKARVLKEERKKENLKRDEEL